MTIDLLLKLVKCHGVDAFILDGKLFAIDVEAKHEEASCKIVELPQDVDAIYSWLGY